MMTEGIAQRAQARVPTDRASRYLEQLCSHLSQISGHAGDHAHQAQHGPSDQPRIVTVGWTENRGVITFDRGAIRLHATGDALEVLVEAQGESALAQLKRAFGARLEMIGRRDELSLTWYRP